MAAVAQSAVSRNDLEVVPYRLSLGEGSDPIVPDENTLEAFRQAAWLQPDEADYHFILGEALLRARRPAEALVAFEEATWRCPGESQYQVALGLALRACGRLSEAEAAFRESARLDPLEPRAHGGAGVCLMELGQPAEGLKALRRAATLSPDSVEAQLNLGMALVEQGAHDEAKAPLRRVTQLAPGEPEAHLQLGAALVATGKDKEGVAEFREALRLAPRCMDARGRFRSCYDAAAHVLIQEGIRAEIGGQASRTSPLRPLVAILDHLPTTFPKVGGALTLLAISFLLLLTFRVGQPFFVNYSLSDEVGRIARAPVRDDSEVLGQVMEAVERHHLGDRIQPGQVTIQTRKASRRITCVYDVPVVVWPNVAAPKLHFRIDVDVPVLIPDEDKVFL